MARILILFSFLLVLTGARSQTTVIDTVSVPDSIMEKKHSPTKATIMSALLPGLGQSYNKKYWKIPVIYAGFGVMGYFIITNANEFNKYRQAYNASASNDSTSPYWYLTEKYTPQNLISARDYYRRNLEVSIIFSALWYILNILDATVDAHLYTYNIGTELSLKVEPVLLRVNSGRNVTSGVKLCLKF